MFYVLEEPRAYLLPSSVLRTTQLGRKETSQNILNMLCALGYILKAIE